MKAVFEACIAIHERMRAMDLQPVADAAAAILDASRDGGKVLVFGNGGSAADAQHMPPNWWAGSSANARRWRPWR